MIYSITLEEFSIKFLLQSENKLHHKVMLSLPRGIIERYASLARGNDLSLSGLPSKRNIQGAFVVLSCFLPSGRIRAHAVHLCVCCKAFYCVIILARRY